MILKLSEDPDRMAPKILRYNIDNGMQGISDGTLGTPHDMQSRSIMRIHVAQNEIQNHTCGDLNTVCQEILWVSWAGAVELTEVLAVVQLSTRQETVTSKPARSKQSTCGQACTDSPKR